MVSAKLFASQIVAGVRAVGLLFSQLASDAYFGSESFFYSSTSSCEGFLYSTEREGGR